MNQPVDGCSARLNQESGNRVELQQCRGDVNEHWAQAATDRADLLRLHSADIVNGGRLPHLPRFAKIIPDSRFNRSFDLGAFLFGIELGSGVRALALYASVFALLLLPFSGTPYGSVVAAAAGWATGRSLPLVSKTIFSSEGREWNDAWPSERRGGVVMAVSWVAIAGAALLHLF